MSILSKIRLFVLRLLSSAVIGFSFTACGDDSGGGGSGGDKDLTGTITISPSTGVTTGTELTATYDGSETVSYQWKNGSTNVGTDSNEFTPIAAGSYTVTVSAAGYKNKTSTAVTVTVGNSTWPEEFGGATQNGTSWGVPNTNDILFYTSTGGSGKSAYMQFTDSMYGYRLVSVNGKTLIVKENSHSETEYTLCTSWTITDNKLTLTGGDSFFSTIMNIPLAKR
jgi:hypothetical protein